MSREICDYEITSEELADKFSIPFLRDLGWSCGRDVWTDADQETPTKCIWHTQQEEKPAADLIAALEADQKRDVKSEPWARRLDEAFLREVDFRDQTDVAFSAFTLIGVDVSGADLSDADLTNASLQRADLSGADLSNADLTNATLPYADLSDADLESADLTNANPVYADLSNADLEGANLTNAEILPADLAGANLQRADLPGADLEGADLINADLKGADLTNAYLGDTILTKVDLQKADLTDADLRDATLTNADVKDADLTNASLWRADLTDADLRDATLTNTNFQSANLTGIALNYTELDNIEIDEATTFGGQSQWEAHPDRHATSAIPYLPWKPAPLRVFGRPRSFSDDLHQAELQYRATQRILRENDLQQLPELAVREKHARRKRVLAERDYWSWLKLAFYRWPFGYGERVRNVLATSVVIILGFAIIYPLFGGMEVTEEGTTQYMFNNPLTLSFQLPEWAEVMWANLYFSAVTFSTLGYGDIQPASSATQALASVQSLLGALLMAYLVFVLGRRTTW